MRVLQQFQRCETVLSALDFWLIDATSGNIIDTRAERVNRARAALFMNDISRRRPQNRTSRSHVHMSTLVMAQDRQC
jgi:hypothetical protein